MTFLDFLDIKSQISIFWFQKTIKGHITTSFKPRNRLLKCRNSMLIFVYNNLDYAFALETIKYDNITTYLSKRAQFDTLRSPLLSSCLGFHLGVEFLMKMPKM